MTSCSDPPGPLTLSLPKVVFFEWLQADKNLPHAGTQAQSLGQRSLGKDMAAHSSILASGEFHGQCSPRVNAWSMGSESAGSQLAMYPVYFLHKQWRQCFKKGVKVPKIQDSYKKSTLLLDRLTNIVIPNSWPVPTSYLRTPQNLGQCLHLEFSVGSLTVLSFQQSLHRVYSRDKSSHVNVISTRPFCKR